jgi:glutaredoxin
MYGTGWCSDCKRAKQFFGEQRVQYDFVDVDVAGRAVIQQHNDGTDIIPTIVFDDSSIWSSPATPSSRPSWACPPRPAAPSTTWWWSAPGRPG